MAERRMFHRLVVESDKFLDLSIGAQALYFHLGMQADDDGERWERRRGREERPERVAAVCRCQGALTPQADAGHRNRKTMEGGKKWQREGCFTGLWWRVISFWIYL